MSRAAALCPPARPGPLIAASWSCRENSIFEDRRPLPPELPEPAADAALFDREPWVEPPLRVDYGSNVRLGAGSFLNFNCTIIDPRPVTIGARTLVGPSVSFYGGTHPLDPAARNGLQGPEAGKEIHVGDDCWIGGQVVILPGVRIGKGCTVGAGSVVTKVVVCSCGPCSYVAYLSLVYLLTIARTCLTFTSWQATQQGSFDGSKRALIPSSEG